MPLCSELDHTMRGRKSMISLVSTHYAKCQKCGAKAEAYTEVNMNSEWGRGAARAKATSAGWRFGPTDERRVYDFTCPACVTAETCTATVEG